MATGPTTRAAAQQQKLEEHLAVILQRLDMQKADLDQRSADQDRVSQERHLQLQHLLQTEVAGLRADLQQQNSKLEGQKACYEELARTQQMQHTQLSQQMQELIGSQQQQMEDVGFRLARAEQKLSAFDQDMEDIKHTHLTDVGRLEERQSSAESRLAAIESGVQQGVSRECGRIAEELQASQTQQIQDLRQEILQEMAKQPGPTETSHKSLLRPEAPLFTPLGSESTTTPTASRGGGGAGEGACTTKTMQRAPPYDGRSTWEAYRTQFEMLARVNNWNEVEKATYLAVSLKGPALTVLSNTSRDNLYNYSSLVTALEARFGSAHQAELHRIKLKNRARKRDESLAELAEDVERLARLAYPEAPPEMMELLAKDQFIDALADGDMRLKMRQSHPKSLWEALQTALELEAFQLASQQRAKPVRGAAIEEREDETTRKDVKQVSCDDLKQCLRECLDNCFHRNESRRRQRRSLGSAQTRRHRGSIKGNCWSCGKPGHMQRDCTEAEKPLSSQPPTNQQGNDQ